jgi:hypothetical protein
MIKIDSSQYSLSFMSFSDQHLLATIQQNIENHEYSEAIKNLFLLLPDITAKLPLQELYSSIFQLISHVDDNGLAKLLGHLSNLLKISSQLPKEQGELAYRLASRYVEQAKALPLNSRFPVYFQAMDLFSRAIQIAEFLNDHALIKDMHRKASKLILDCYLAIESFQADLEKARREENFKKVETLLSRLDQLKAFCCYAEDKEVIKKFYLQARDFLEEIPIAQIDHYKHHRQMVKKGLSQPFELPSLFPTQRYQKGLKNFRDSFANIDPEDVRKFKLL